MKDEIKSTEKAILEVREFLPRVMLSVTCRNCSLRFELRNRRYERLYCPKCQTKLFDKAE